VTDRVVEAFEDTVGRAPDGVWSAPGRVNLIGEHIDYNDGHVLPLAIDLHTSVAAGRRNDDQVRCWSLQDEQPVTTSLRELRSATGWSAYLLGTLWALREMDVDVPGMDVFVDGRVPLGSGLSSSAALECATALAAVDLAGVSLDLISLAKAGQRAEHDLVGAPVGLMDQVASLAGEAGRAVLFDCRSLEIDLVPLPLDETGSSLVVIDTKVQHDLADGAYGDRRRECAAAAAALGVPSLRDATLESVLAADLPDLLRRRARHVVTEEQRVVDTVRLLAAHDMPGVGEQLVASHESLRDDYEVSVPEVDGTVEAALDAGALGARITGGGFGGCVVALVDRDHANDVIETVAERAAREGWPEPSTYDGAPVGGAHREH